MQGGKELNVVNEDGEVPGAQDQTGANAPELAIVEKVRGGRQLSECSTIHMLGKFIHQNALIRGTER
jgi:hypothetical protein